MGGTGALVVLEGRGPLLSLVESPCRFHLATSDRALPGARAVARRVAAAARPAAGPEESARAALRAVALGGGAAVDLS